MIITSDKDVLKSSKVNESDNEKFRSELREFYSKFNVDLSNYKFIRDELYDRP